MIGCIVKRINRVYWWYFWSILEVVDIGLDSFFIGSARIKHIQYFFELNCLFWDSWWWSWASLILFFLFMFRNTVELIICPLFVVLWFNGSIEVDQLWLWVEIEMKGVLGWIISRCWWTIFIDFMSIFVRLLSGALFWYFLFIN
jgi:hypothetical protein